MIEKIKRSAAVIACLAAANCASLEVQVDILDPDETRRLAYISELLSEYYAVLETDSQIATQRVNDLRQRHFRANEQVAEAYHQTADELESESKLSRDALDEYCEFPNPDSEVDGAPEKSLTDAELKLQEACYLRLFADDQITPFNPGRTLDKLYSDYLRETLSYNNRIYSIDAANQALDADNVPTTLLRTALAARRETLEALRSSILLDLKYSEGVSQTDSGRTIDDSEARAAARDVALQWQTITGGRSLVDSNFAYTVASADESYWANEFNRAFGDATFGNSDIIIKLDRAGEFTVKGMQFDPSTVAAVASKVTVQSLLLAATISGVPVQSADLPEDQRTIGFGATGDSARSDQQTLLERQAGISAKDDALRKFARIILSEEAGLRATGAGATDARGNAIRAIAEHFDANSELIGLTEVD